MIKIITHADRILTRIRMAIEEYRFWNRFEAPMDQLRFAIKTKADKTRTKIMLSLAGWVLEWYGDQACWARLVCWALFDTSEDQFWYAINTKECRQDADEIFGGWCYCGHVRLEMPYIGLRFILFGR